MDRRDSAFSKWLQTPKESRTGSDSQPSLHMRFDGAGRSCVALGERLPSNGVQSFRPCNHLCKDPQWYTSFIIIFDHRGSRKSPSIPVQYSLSRLPARIARSLPGRLINPRQERQNCLLYIHHLKFALPLLLGFPTCFEVGLHRASVAQWRNIGWPTALMKMRIRLMTSVTRKVFKQIVPHWHKNIPAQS